MMRRLLFVIALLPIPLAPAAASQDGKGELIERGPDNLTWHTIDSGGTTSEGGLFALTGTIAQPDPGASTGGSYALDGGFWPGTGNAVGGHLFSDDFESGDTSSWSVTSEP